MARPLSLSSILLQLESKPAGSTGEFLIDSEILYAASYESAVTDMYWVEGLALIYWQTLVL